MTAIGAFAVFSMFAGSISSMFGGGGGESARSTLPETGRQTRELRIEPTELEPSVTEETLDVKAAAKRCETAMYSWYCDDLLVGLGEADFVAAFVSAAPMAQCVLVEDDHDYCKTRLLALGAQGFAAAYAVATGGEEASPEDVAANEALAEAMTRCNTVQQSGGCKDLRDALGDSEFVSAFETTQSMGQCLQVEGPYHASVKNYCKTQLIALGVEGFKAEYATSNN